jgi:hypothetical protein
MVLRAGGWRAAHTALLRLKGLSDLSKLDDSSSRPASVEPLNDDHQLHAIHSSDPMRPDTVRMSSAFETTRQQITGEAAEAPQPQQAQVQQEAQPAAPPLRPPQPSVTDEHFKTLERKLDDFVAGFLSVQRASAPPPIVTPTPLAVERFNALERKLDTVVTSILSSRRTPPPLVTPAAPDFEEARFNKLEQKLEGLTAHLLRAAVQPPATTAAAGSSPLSEDRFRALEVKLDDLTSSMIASSSLASQQSAAQSRAIAVEARLRQLDEKLELAAHYAAQNAAAAARLQTSPAEDRVEVLEGKLELLESVVQGTAERREREQARASPAPAPAPKRLAKLPTQANPMASLRVSVPRSVEDGERALDPASLGSRRRSVDYWSGRLEDLWAHRRDYFQSQHRPVGVEVWRGAESGGQGAQMRRSAAARSAGLESLRSPGGPLL